MTQCLQVLGKLDTTISNVCQCQIETKDRKYVSIVNPREIAVVGLIELWHPVIDYLNLIRLFFFMGSN